jgi:hypothetical protein
MFLEQRTVIKNDMSDKEFNVCRIQTKEALEKDYEKNINLFNRV